MKWSWKNWLCGKSSSLSDGKHAKKAARKGARSAARRAAPLLLEQLEDRVVPAGSWMNLAASGTAPANGGAAMVSLSDGTLLVQNGLNTNAQAGSSSFSRLSPQAGTGSYVNGVWSNTGSMNETRLFFPTAVLPDGRVFAAGGEYGLNGGTASDSNTVEIYNPVGNNGVGSWSFQDTFPKSQFGDDPVEVLSPDSTHPDGQVLVGYINGPATYLFDPDAAAGHQWTQTKVGKLRNDQSDEEAWVKLPDGSILSYDVYASAASGKFQAQRYVPSLDAWVDASSVNPFNPPSVLSTNQGSELGPGFLEDNGNVIYFGANGNTAIYDSNLNVWSAGPAEPQKLLTLTPVNNAKGQLVSYSVTAGGPLTSLVGTDDPGAVLPNGHILIALSPLGSGNPNFYTFPQATYIYEYDPNAPAATAFTEVTPSGGLNVNAFQLNMVVLPTGQVLLSNEGNVFQVYTEDPATGPSDASRPTITGITPNITGTYQLTGTQLNGISEGANYGDDNQSASNYPIVRLTDLNGNVSYATTFFWSSTRVDTGNTPEHVTFALPGGDGPGVYYLSTIANGVASIPVLFVLGSSDDTVTVGSTNILFFTLPSVTINGTPVFYDPNAIAGIDIVAGGDSVINVRQTYVPVDIEGTEGDTVNIGSQAPNLGGTLANINAPVHVGNSFGSTIFSGSPFGFTTLNVDDSGDASVNTSHMGTIFGDPGLGYIVDLAPALITYDYKTTASLTIGLSAANGDFFGVYESGVPTTINGNGPDTVAVGDGFVGVQSILSTLNIENAPSFTTITIDDSADTTFRSAFLDTFGVAGSFGAITGLAPGEINFKYADTRSVTASTGVGGATVNVRATGTNTTLLGNSINTTVNVGDFGLVENILGNLTIQSVPSQTAVNVDDSADRTFRNVTLSNVTLPGDGDGDNDAGGQISGLAPALIRYEYIDVSGVAVSTGVGGATVNVLATGAATSLHGNSDNTTVNVGDAGSVQNIEGNLTIQNQPARTTVNVDDSADRTYRDATLSTVTLADDGDGDDDSFGLISDLAPALIRYEYFDVSGVTIDTGGVGATVNVLATGVATSLQGNGFSFGDNTTVNVGDAGIVQNILGALTVENQAAFTAVNVNDSADGTFRNVTLSTVTLDNDNDGDSDAFGRISGLAPALINYEYFDTSGVTVSTGLGGATVNVLATGVATSLQANGYDDIVGTTVNVGDAGSVQNILGNLTIQNEPSLTAVNVDDSADRTFRNVTLSNVTLADDGDGDNDAAGQISGLAPALIRYEYIDVSAVTVKTGGVGATVNVLATGVATSLQGNGFLGVENTTVNVGDAGSVQNIRGDLTIQNEPAHTTVNVNDSADAVGRTVTLSTVTLPNDGDFDSDAFGRISGLAPALISYEYNDTSSVTIDTGIGGATVNVLATGVATSLQGNGYDDIVGTTVNVGDAGSVGNILGALTIQNEPSLTAVNVDDSADRTFRNVTLSNVTLADDGDGDYDAGGQISGLAPALIRYEYIDVSAVTVKTGGVGATVNVLATGVATSLIGNGPLFGENTTVNVGDAGSVQNIRGDLTIENPNAFTAVNVDDSADATFRNATLSTVTLADDFNDVADQIGGLAPALIRYEHDGTSGVTIRTGGFGPTVNVLATSVVTSLQGNGSFNAITTVNIGDNGSVQNILGNLTIQNAPSFTAVNVDDSADGAVRNVTLSTVAIPDDGGADTAPAGQISGLAPALIRYEYNDTNGVTVNTGTGGATINVLATGVATNLLGHSANTIVNVGDAGSVQNIQGALAIENPPSFTTLNVDDSADPVGRTVTLSAASIIAGQISGLAPALITYRYRDTASPLTINGGGGGNTFVVSDITDFFNGPTIVLNTGAGDDVVEANVSDVGGVSPLTVNGQAGNNRLVVTGADSPTLTNVPSPTQAGAGVIDAIYSSPALMRAIAYSNIGSIGATTTTQVSSNHSASGSVYGQQVVLTAVVSSGAGVPTGSVQFLVNGAAFGPAVALSGGTASLTTTALPAGSLLISARFTSAGVVFANSGAASLAETVTPAPLTITADNQQAPFGGPFPVFTVHYAGFVNGDAPASLTTPPTVTTTATAASVAGNYAITASGAVDSNYAITYVSGVLTIIQPLSVLTTQTPNALQGVSTGSVLLATFTQGSVTQAGAYTASVNWADGHVDTSAETQSPLTIVVSGQTISVYGSHTYATSGKFNSSVTLFGSQTQATANPTINVAANLSSSGQIKSSASGLVYNRATKLFGGTLTLANNGPTTLSGQLEVVFRGLPAGVVLKNASGYDADGDPYILVNIGALPPGRTVTFSLSFSNPNSVLFGYDLSVFDEPNTLNA